jgi:hypothetical protein
MWNLLKYVPDVFSALRSRGFDYEVRISDFRTELKRATGVMTDKTIAKWMKSLVELGYIKLKNDKILEVSVDFEHPYFFASDEGVEVVKPVSNPKLEEVAQNIKEANILKEK